MSNLPRVTRRCLPVKNEDVIVLSSPPLICQLEVAIPTLPFPFSAGQRRLRAFPYPLQAKSVLFSGCLHQLFITTVTPHGVLI